MPSEAQHYRHVPPAVLSVPQTSPRSAHTTPRPVIPTATRSFWNRKSPLDTGDEKSIPEQNWTEQRAFRVGNRQNRHPRLLLGSSMCLGILTAFVIAKIIVDPTDPEAVWERQRQENHLSTRIGRRYQKPRSWEETKRGEETQLGEEEAGLGNKDDWWKPKEDWWKTEESEGGREGSDV